jgi:hypothetical protein
MNALALAAGLYPLGLAAANFGVGAGLYLAGAPLVAGLLLLCGLFVLAGIVSAAGSTLQRPLETVV